MKTHLANRFSKMLPLRVWIAIIAAPFVAHADDLGPQLVAEVRQALRQQGFKTDLSEFNLSTSPVMRAREAILKAAVPEQTSGPSPFQINLMETVGTNSAIVLWKQDRLKLQYRLWPENKAEMSWQSLGKMLNENRSALDAACAAAMVGPIAFNLNASAGNAILLPHLALLKILEQTLGCRTVLDLHDGNLDEAWTNLMAATCLVTAWQVEPMEISELIRFNNTTVAYHTTWQALQTNGWSDEQLARVQQEWESVNFSTNLPETIAFERASDVALCRRGRQQVPEFELPFKQFFIVSLQDPREIWLQMRDAWYAAQSRRSYDQYRRYGMYDDETNLLLFYRNREIEVRNAIQARSWMQMRELPGVTNQIYFHSKYGSPLQAMMNIHRIQLAYQLEGISFMGRAAEAEARRRILITAIALERYRGKYGSYPDTLAKLAPAFLKAVPPDFMDGHPLRYRLANDGHFFLYSVGLNCADDGGKFPTQTKGGQDWHAGPGNAHLLGTDILWPLPD
jgi:hypothetical protein